MNVKENIHDRQGARTASLILHPMVFLTLRLFFGALFLYAGSMKLADTAGFSQTISAYRILPDPLVPCAAMGLPAVEVVVGLGTMLNRRWAMLGMLALMILFMGVLSYGVAIGLDIDCGCFSAGAEPSRTAQSPLPSIDLGLSAGEGTGIPIIPVDPDPGEGGEGVCSGDGGDPTKLRLALFRDFFLFLGVIYIVAWPDLRKKYGLEKPFGVQARTFPGEG